MFYCCAFLNYQTFSLAIRAAPPRQVLCPLNLFNSLRHFPHPSPNFLQGEGAKKIRNMASIFDPSRL